MAGPKGATHIALRVLAIGELRATAAAAAAGGGGIWRVLQVQESLQCGVQLPPHLGGIEGGPPGIPRRQQHLSLTQGAVRQGPWNGGVPAP